MPSHPRAVLALLILVGLASCQTPRYVEPPPMLQVDAYTDGSFSARWDGRTAAEWLRLAESGGRDGALRTFTFLRAAPGDPTLLPSIERLINASRDPDTVQYALGALASYSPCDQALPLLLRAVEHREPRVRSFAVRQLGTCREAADTVVPVLIDQLEDPETRNAAIEALGDLGPEAREAAPRLLPQLPSYPSDMNLLKALSVIDPTLPEPIPYLIDRLGDVGCLVWATQALVRYGELAVEPLLVALRETGSPCAMDVLLQIGKRAALPSEVLDLFDPVRHNRSRSRLLGCFAGRAARIAPYSLAEIRAGRDATWELVGLGDTSVVLPLLEDTDPDVRRAGVEVLGRLGDASVVPALRRAAHEDERLVRLEAAYALIEMGEPADAAPLLREAFDDPDVEARKRAVKITQTLGPRVRELAPDLRAKIQRSGDARWIYAFGALGALSEPDVAWLARQLQSPRAAGNRVYFSAILGILEKQGGAAAPALPALLQALRRQTSRTPYLHRQELVERIGGLGPKARSALPVLRRQLADHQVRVDIALAIHEIDPEDQSAVPYLGDHLRRSHPCDARIRSSAVGRFAGSRPRHWRRVRAAMALWRIAGDPRVVATLIEEVFPNDHATTDANVIQALGEIGPPASFAVPWIRVASRELEQRSGYTTFRFGGDQKNFGGRSIAAEALFRITGDTEPYRRFLLHHLEEGELEDSGNGFRDSVRASCARLLPELGASVVDALVPFVRARDPLLRFYTIKTLGAIGAGAEPALPALREAREDERSKVREAARQALEAITNQLTAVP